MKRREMMIAGAIGVAGAAMPIPAAASRAMRNGLTPDAQLADLIQQVKLLAMTVDPSITECWVTWDESGEDRRLSGFFFKRGGQQHEAA